MPYSDIETQHRFQREWVRERRRKFIEQHGGCEICGTLENIRLRRISKEAPKPNWSWKHSRLEEMLDAGFKIRCMKHR